MNVYRNIQSNISLINLAHLYSNKHTFPVLIKLELDLKCSKATEDRVYK